MSFLQHTPIIVLLHAVDVRKAFVELFFSALQTQTHQEGMCAACMEPVKHNAVTAQFLWAGLSSVTTPVPVLIKTTCEELLICFFK